MEHITILDIFPKLRKFSNIIFLKYSYSKYDATIYMEISVCSRCKAYNAM